jgi:hypothetical protein
MATNYTQQYLDECKGLAEVNHNYRLYRLKKCQQKQVCIHYGLATTGKKMDLEERIIRHRDTLYTYTPPTIVEIKALIHRYGLTNRTKETFTNYHKYNSLRLFKHESKINLSILYAVLSKIKDISERPDNSHWEAWSYAQPIQEIYEKYESSGWQYIAGLKLDINNIVDEIREISESYEQRQERLRQNLELIRQQQRNKVVYIQNTTNQIIYIYRTIKRTDYPDYSKCKLAFTLNIGEQKIMRYSSDNTMVIGSRTDKGNRCYYLDIKDYLVSEKKVTEKRNITNMLTIENNRSEVDQWREAALKCDFLLKELKRLGIEKNDNYAAIVDMHQDITIPQHSERDKDIAGIPSAFTNVT